MSDRPLQPLQWLSRLALEISRELERYHDHADTRLRFRVRKVSLLARKLAAEIDGIPRPKVALTKKSVAPWWRRRLESLKGWWASR